MSQDGQIIHSFPKNALEEIRISLSSYKGKQYIDFRVYYKADDGEFRPSKKGMTIAPDLFPEMEEAMKKLRDALNE
ncbi:MAG: transcriptional coactivator p15/PC4 family protein [Syntrophobacteraceae bacterium]